MEKMISPDRALELVLANAPGVKTAVIPLAAALGCTLAEDVRADRPYPPFPRAMMDGFAVRLSDAGREIPVAGMIAAGDHPSVVLAAGACIEIMTGAACPDGAEAVVPYESVTRNGERVLLPQSVKPGANIALPGSECAADAVVLRGGARIDSLAIAVLASFGHDGVAVHPPPSIGIIATGKELAPAGSQPDAVQIRDSNGPLLAAMARESGVIDIRAAIAGDDRAELERQLASMADRDILILSGGVSAGKFDLVPETLVAWGAEAVFHKVTQRPGKPLLFARRGRMLIFALPGNPLACHLGFHRYIAPAIRRMTAQDILPARFSGRLSHTVATRGDRTFFQLARIETDGDQTRVRPLKGKGSADIFAACGANAYLRLEPDSELEAGTIVSGELIGRNQWRI